MYKYDVICIIIYFDMLKMRLFRVENNRRRSYELSTCGVCGVTKIRAESRPKRDFTFHESFRSLRFYAL